MTDPSRRRVLRQGALSGLAAATAGTSLGLAGCLGGLGVGDGSDAITLERAAGPGPDQIPLSVDDAPILLDFFATWCAPCVPQSGSVKGVVLERPDVHVVSVTNESDADAISQWWDMHGGDWPAVMDPEANATSQYNSPRLPTTLVLPPGSGPREETWRHVGVARTKTMLDELAAAESGTNGNLESDHE